MKLFSNPANCAECAPVHDRRHFFRMIGGAAVYTAGGRFFTDEASAAPLRAANHQAKPTENLVREFYATLNPWQRQQLVYPWNHAGTGSAPARLGVYNTCIGKAVGESCSPAQRELVERILVSMSSGEEGYRKITRNGSWDSDNGILSGGAYFFGDPESDRKFSFLFTGHHLTLRCDGNSEPDTAFGGPIFYGHIVNGYSQRNVFNDQTRSVMAFFEALNPEQQQAAVIRGRPPGRDQTVAMRSPGKNLPGLAAANLSAEQKRHAETVLRDLLAPYRAEDVEEVMQIVRANGGMDRIHTAFYQDTATSEQEPWSYWRLEGPGFLWNFRVLPHVHTYVSIAKA